MRWRVRPGYAQAKDYYLRGITVEDPRWLTSFEAFDADVPDPPGPGWSLDRKDNDRGYFKENVRWVTRSEQERNKRKVVAA